ncbi:MAG: TrpB-like pyridoxal phosphate-dependent enzyme, partial [Rhodospirillaceae bacterium]|nr:TrpB-like pyridoxal phosphate-dependent enzyme [Rhodospirillaceae bacterium]
GQWGSALAYAGQLLGIQVDVWMVRVSFDQKPFRKTMMETWGARCVASPSPETEVGRKILEEDPDTPGSLGIAISEAIEAAVTDPSGTTRYSLGSVLNHVLLHQTVIGLEARVQMEQAGEYPDAVFASCGGGSNFGGIAFPFFADKAAGKEVRLVAVEPVSCPTLTKGTYTWDYGDTAGLTPIMKMFTLGHDFVPPGIHAGGLRYHGMSPLVSHLLDLGLIEARSQDQIECFEAGVQFARSEGIVPAPESTHAIRAAIDEALECKKNGESKTILFNLSGHGYFDMQAYTDYFDGKLSDEAYDEDALARSLAAVPEVAAE